MGQTKEATVHKMCDTQKKKMNLTNKQMLPKLARI